MRFTFYVVSIYCTLKMLQFSLSKYLVLNPMLHVHARYAYTYP